MNTVTYPDGHTETYPPADAPTIFDHPPYTRRLSRAIDTAGTITAAAVLAVTTWTATRTDRKETR